MAKTALPHDLAAYARIDDPKARADIEDKLKRYIARGLWAQEALARLQEGSPPGAAEDEAAEPQAEPTGSKNGK